MGKNDKDRLKIKEKVEILPKVKFQKRGNQLKGGTLTPLRYPNYSQIQESKAGNNVIIIRGCVGRSLGSLYFFNNKKDKERD